MGWGLWLYEQVIKILILRTSDKDSNMSLQRIFVYAMGMQHCFVMNSFFSFILKRLSMKDRHLTLNIFVVLGKRLFVSNIIYNIRCWLWNLQKNVCFGHLIVYYKSHLTITWEEADLLRVRSFFAVVLSTLWCRFNFCFAYGIGMPMRN